MMKIIVDGHFLFIQTLWEICLTRQLMERFPCCPEYFQGIRTCL